MTDELRNELAAALILHDHPERNSLTRPEDPLVMLRTDPTFHVCAAALARADALLPIVERRIARARAATLRWAADKIDAGPDVPLPPSVYSTLLREYADDAGEVGSDGN